MYKLNVFHTIQSGIVLSTVSVSLRESENSDPRIAALNAEPVRAVDNHRGGFTKRFWFIPSNPSQSPPTNPLSSAAAPPPNASAPSNSFNRLFSQHPNYPKKESRYTCTTRLPLWTHSWSHRSYVEAHGPTRTCLSQ